ncbi:MAG: sugar phosphate isomerase/epimerase [Clostridia bacterium]|nr:sugar phosphate isomerase/epimerase [Clostridia bacterium]
MKLATSSGDYLRYVPTIVGAVREFSGSKFKYINLELGNTFPADEEAFSQMVDTYREAAEYAGVKYSTSHASCVSPANPLTEENYKSCVQTVKRSIELSGRLGIERTVVHAVESTALSKHEFLEINKRFYHDIMPVAERYGMRVMTENTDDFDRPLTTGKEMMELVKYVDHPLLGVCWDTAHANLNERARAVGQYECLCDIGDKLWGLHISDNFGLHSHHHHSWPFNGNINWDSVLKALVDVNYDGFFTFEASYTLFHHRNCSCGRKPWVHEGEEVSGVFNPSLELKKKAVDLLYECGKYLLTSYGLYEE